MKKITRWWAAWTVVLVVYHVIVFAVPFPKTPAFVISYLFTLAALGAQIYVFRTAFTRDEGVKSKFYGWPIARLGVLYLAVQMILGLLFMGLGTAVPVWIPVVLFVLLLCVAVIGFLSTDAIRDEIHRQDVKLQKDVMCMRALQSKAVSMVQAAQNSQVHKALEKFSENLHFSDPVSSESLKDIESDLTACVEELHQAVTDGDHNNALALIQKAEGLLIERNRLCKLDKRLTH